MRVPPLIYFCFFSGVFLSSSRVTGACPVTTDLIMRVNNVRTTTTKPTSTTTTTAWTASDTGIGCLEYRNLDFKASDDDFWGLFRDCTLRVTGRTARLSRSRAEVPTRTRDRLGPGEVAPVKICGQEKIALGGVASLNTN